MKERKKGISLIVLIVTIIVMIIIAGAIIISLTNANIIEQGENAVTKYNLSSEKEGIQLAVNSALLTGEGKLTETNLTNSLDGQLGADEYILINNGDGTYSLTINSTESTYKIENGGVEYIAPIEKPAGYDKLYKYIYGEDGKGRVLYSVGENGEIINGIFNPATFKFIGDDIIPDAEDTVVMENTVKDEDRGIITYYARYNGVLYASTIKMENNEYKIDKLKVQFVKPENSLLGSYVTYKGKDWIVLYDDTTNGLQLLSAENIGDVTLGYDNSEYSTIGDYETDADKVIAEYNGAIDKLVAACKAYTGINENIRCVGGPATDTTTTYFTSSNIENYTGTTFTKYEGIFKIGDKNYIKDFNQMINLGIFNRDIKEEEEFWLASRATYSPYVDFSFYDWAAPFYIRCIGKYYSEYICSIVLSSGSAAIRGSDYTKGVRAVVTLEDSYREMLKNQKAHTGTAGDPYVIE